MSLLLARQDVDVDAQCRGEERQALAYSCIRGHESVTKLLLAREDVNINAENKMGCTALIDVVVRYKTNNRAKEIVGLLLAQDNLEVTYRDRSGMTALIMACQKDFKEGVVLLLGRVDIDVNSRITLERRGSCTHVNTNQRSWRYYSNGPISTLMRRRCARWKTRGLQLRSSQDMQSDK